MPYSIEDKQYPIGLTKVIMATTLEDLRLALNELKESGFDLHMGWHGWDDGSIIGHCAEPRLHIESEAT